MIEHEHTLYSRHSEYNNNVSDVGRYDDAAAIKIRNI